MRATFSAWRSFPVSIRRRFLLAALIGGVFFQASGDSFGQQPGNNPPGQNVQRAAPGPVGGQPNGLFAGPGANAALNGNGNGNGQGGAANADFDSLIDLIVSTVATDTWAENGGGQAEIRPFPTGVMVDATGAAAGQIKSGRVENFGGQTRHSARG